jgi:hypothetical protein
VIFPWWVRLAEELWPRGSWNEQIKKLWQERLTTEGKSNPEELAQCIRNVRCMRSSERVEIAWVLAELAEYRRRKAGQQGNLQSRIEAATIRQERERAMAEEVADEDAARRTALSMLPPEELSRLKALVSRSLPHLRMHGHPSGWSGIAVGLVHAAGIESGSWLTSSREPSPAPGPSCATGGSASTDPPRHPSSSLPAEMPHGTALVGASAQSLDPAEFW